MRRVLFGAALLCLATAVFAGDGTIHRKARAIRGSYLVMFDDAQRPDVAAVADELARKHGGSVTYRWTAALRGFAIETTEAAATAIARDRRVAVVEEDTTGELLDHQICSVGCWPTQTSSHCANGKVGWQLDRIDRRTRNEMDGNFEYCEYRKGYYLRAYVIDTGVVPHEDFTDPNGLTRIAGGKTYVQDGRGTVDCYNGHGTHVTSFMAGRFSGAAKDATIVPIRLADCNGNGVTASRTTDAVNWVVQDYGGGPAVLNISLKFSGSTALDSAVNNAVAAGILVTTGSGNDGGNTCSSSPQRAIRAITVGATDINDQFWSRSGYGACVSMLAPGVGVGGAHWGAFNYYDCSPGWSGTSMAAPLVAGVAGVLYEARWYAGSNPTPQEITDEMIVAAAQNLVAGVPTGTPNRLLQSVAPAICEADQCQVVCH